ncbi:MAG: hypothetical protein AB7Q16_11785 [Vicinamibacterales bacterium]
MNWSRLVTGMALVGVMAPGVAAAQQGEQVTVQLRDGTVVRGALEDLEDGTLYVRVSLHDQRRLPIGDVVLIDRTGSGSALPEAEVRAAESAAMVVLSNGGRLEGTLVDVHGGPGSGDPEKARTFILRMPDGAERRLAAAEVNRVYLGRVAAAAESPVPAGAIRVRASAGWVDTGLVVRQGQMVGFATTGTVQLSPDPADTASSPGRDRTAAGAPMPALRAGALIGRIGPNGQPFGIGNQASVPMPATGQLFLAVNDDVLTDNSGAFDVVITPAATQR